MVETSDYCAAVLNLSLYLKLLLHLTLPCVLLIVTHVLASVKLLYLRPCETCIMLNVALLAILA
jgi:hypothetical protein